MSAFLDVECRHWPVVLLRADARNCSDSASGTVLQHPGNRQVDRKMQAGDGDELVRVSTNSIIMAGKQRSRHLLPSGMSDTQHRENASTRTCAFLTMRLLGVCRQGRQQLPVHQEVRIAADGAGEVRVVRQRQTEVAASVAAPRRLA